MGFMERKIENEKAIEGSSETAVSIFSLKNQYLLLNLQIIISCFFCK